MNTLADCFPNSLINRPAWIDSPFRPPQPEKVLPRRKTLTATAMPFVPLAERPITAAEPRAPLQRAADIPIVDSGANGSTRTPAAAPAGAPGAAAASPLARGRPPAMKIATSAADLPSVASDSSVFSPLSTPVTMFFHTFTDEATAQRKYPLDMFLSVRRDASHTPLGILKWSVRQYVNAPALKVPRHLVLSVKQVQDVDDEADRAGLGTKANNKQTRVVTARQIDNKVMSILSRLTEDNYDDLLSELQALPLRQTKDDELQKVVDVFFDKAVRESKFCGLYARLVNQICSMSAEERALDAALHQRMLCVRFKRTLLDTCRSQIKKPLVLSPDDLVDRNTGAPLSEAEVSTKKANMKNRLVGNVKFIGELYNLHLVGVALVDEILRQLMADFAPERADDKEEYIYEVFTNMVRTTADSLKAERPALLRDALGFASVVEEAHSKPRVRFQMMDLRDDNLKKKQWIVKEEVLAAANRIKGGGPAVNGTATRVGGGVAPLGTAAAPPGPIGHPAMQHHQHQHQHQHSMQLPPSAQQRLSQPQPYVAPTAGARAPPGLGQPGQFHPPQPPASVGYAPAPIGGKINAVQPPPQPPLPMHHHHHQGHYQPPPQQQQQPLPPPALGLAPPLPQQQQQHRLPPRGEPPASPQGGAPRPGGVGAPAAGGVRVDMCVTAQQLMEQFGSGEPGACERVVACLGEMAVRDRVFCLTWWLRLVATETRHSAERKQVPHLLAMLLRAPPAPGREASSPVMLFDYIAEWLRFDAERRQYERCPRMYENIAHMIYSCHDERPPQQPNADDVRHLLFPGLFNIVLQALATEAGRAQMVTMVKSAHVVTTNVLLRTREPKTPALALRAALECRFRLLPYFLSLHNSTDVEIPGTPSSGSRTPDMRAASLGDSVTSLPAHYDPMSQCMSVSCGRLSDDPEFALFRHIRKEAAHGDAWRAEALRLATAGEGANLTSVARAVQVMKVIGTLLACESVAAGEDTLLAATDVNAAAREILEHFKTEPLFGAAALMEIIFHFTQAGRVAPSARAATCIRTIRMRLQAWRIGSIFDGRAVQELVGSLSDPGVHGEFTKVIASYLNCLVAERPEFQWPDIHRSIS